MELRNFIVPMLKKNCLNNYFSSVSTISESDTSLPVFTPKTESTLENFEIEEGELIDTLSSLNTNEVVGPNEISHRMKRNPFNYFYTMLYIV